MGVPPCQLPSSSRLLPSSSYREISEEATLILEAPSSPNPKLLDPYLAAYQRKVLDQLHAPAIPRQPQDPYYLPYHCKMTLEAFTAYLKEQAPAAQRAQLLEMAEAGPFHDLDSLARVYLRDFCHWTQALGPDEIPSRTKQWLPQLLDKDPQPQLWSRVLGLLLRERKITPEQLKEHEKHLDYKSWPKEALVHLMKAQISYGPDGSKATLNFLYNHGGRLLEPHQRIELLKACVPTLPKTCAMTAFGILGWERENISREQCVTLCTAIDALDPGSYYVWWRSDNLGFVDEFKQCQNLDESLALMRRFISEAPWGASVVLMWSQLSKFSKLDPAVRLELCHLIIAQGEYAAAAIFHERTLISLNDHSIAERLDLARRVAATGPFAKKAVEQHAYRLQLKDAFISGSNNIVRFKELAREGSWTTLFLLNHWREYAIPHLPEQEQLDIYRDMVAHGNHSAILVATHQPVTLGNCAPQDLRLALAKNAPLATMKQLFRSFFGWSSPSQRVALLKTLVQGDYQTIALLAADLKVYSQRIPCPNDRLRIYMEVAKCSPAAAETLASDLDKIHLTGIQPEQRLELFHAIIAHGGTAAAQVGCFFNPEFPQPFEGLSTTQRFQLATTIAADGSAGARSMRQQYHHIRMDQNQRFELAMAIATSDYSGRIARNLSALGVSLEQRHLLAKKIIANYWSNPSCELAESFELAGLDELCRWERLELCYAILSRGRQATKALIENLEKFGVQELPAQERLKLLHAAVQQGPETGKAVAENFSSLGLDDLPLSDRCHLCATIERSGYFLPHDKQLFPFAFEKDLAASPNIEERIALCKGLLKYGDWASSTLCSNWAKLGLEDASTQQILDLCGSMEKSGSYHKLAPVFKQLGLIEKINAGGGINLALQVARAGKWGTCGIAANLNTLNLNSQELFSLATTLLTLNPETGDALSLNLKSLQLPTGDLLNLVQRLAQSGYGSPNTLLSALRELPGNSCIPIYEKIISSSENSAVLFVREVETGSLNNYSLQIRLRFCRLCIAQGPIAAKTVAHYFKHFGLDAAHVKHRIELYRAIAQYGRAHIKKIVKEFQGPGSLKHPLFLEMAQMAAGMNDDRPPKMLASDIQHLLHILLYAEEQDPLLQELGEELANTPLEEIYASNQHVKDPSLNLHLCKWIAYAYGLLKKHRSTRLNLIHSSKALHHIYHHRNPTLRYGLTRRLSYLSKEDLAFLNTLSKPKQQLAYLAIHFLAKKDSHYPWAEAMLQEITSLRSIKETQFLSEILTLFLSIDERGPYSTQEKALLRTGLLQLFTSHRSLPQKERCKTLRQELKSLKALVDIFGSEALLHCLTSEQPPQQFFTEHFQTLFELNDFPDFPKAYQESLGQFRDITALVSYLGSIRKLGTDTRAKVKADLNSYVESVLDGSFHSKRYAPELNPHLKQLFDHDPKLEERWRAPITAKMVKRSSQSANTPDYKEIFRIKILQDGHLLPLDDYPYLRDYLQNKSIDQKTLENEKSPQAEFQKLLIGLCENKIQPEALIEGIIALNLNLGELQNDINSLISNEEDGQLIVSESDDPCDLLLAGTEIQGSCQRVNGSPYHNKCLVGYLLNGECRLIAIKRDGKLVARSILRLLWDPTAQTPVLLLERVYKNIFSDDITNAIRQAAISKAESMAIPLVSKSVGNGSCYPNDIAFAGGRASYIYCDSALHGIQSQGFTVSRTHQLYNPAQAIAASSC